MKLVSKVVFIFIFFFSLSKVLAAQTADQETPDRLESSATLDFNGDNNHNKGAGLSTNIGLNPEYQIYGGLSSLKNDDTNSLTTTEINLGIGTDTSRKTAWSIGIDSSNTPRLFTINSLNAEFFWNINEDWSLHFLPGLRKIKTFSANDSEYDYQSTFLTSGVSYFGLKNWHFKGELTLATLHKTRGEQSFAELSPQAKAAFANARSQAMTDLSSSIFVFEFGYTFKIVELSLEDLATTSAKQFRVQTEAGQFQRLRTNTLTLKSVWFIADSWDLGVNIASNRSMPTVTGQNNLTRSLDANITYYW